MRDEHDGLELRIFVLKQFVPLVIVKQSCRYGSDVFEEGLASLFLGDIVVVEVFIVLET